MKRFYIKQITASGEGVKFSAIDFDKGLNIIHGPSNTGKSYVIGCINFMFGSDDIPFTKSATGYDTVTRMGTMLFWSVKLLMAKTAKREPGKSK